MSVTRTVLAIVAVVASLGSAAAVWVEAAQVETAQKKVLVLYSTRRDTTFPTIADRELPQLLERALGARPDFYSEHMDAVRFPEPQYRAAFREYLMLKYAGIRFDVVIALQSIALEFIAGERDTLFPGTPVVFLTEEADFERLPNSAGGVMGRDYLGTLALISTLQPETREVFVVTGSSARDRVAEQTAKEQFASADTSLTLTYLSNLSSEDLERRLTALPPRSVVYYLLFYQDATGTNVNPVDYLGRLAAIANRPVYCWIDTSIEQGIVGGSLLSIESELVFIAGLASRVLRGEPADAIPLATPNLYANQVDWRQLQRWNISEARIPEGTLVRFRQPGIFERYWMFILGVATLLAAQMALIAGLLVQRVRRRRAEEKLRANQAELRASYERLRDVGGRLIAAQEEERTRFARELHDDIGQKLAVLAMDLGQLDTGDRPQRGDVERLAREALECVHDVTRSVRDMSHRLHPARLRLIGLVGALAGLGREQPSTMAVTFTHESLPDAIAPDLSLCMYRIAQEALQNAARHSGARGISMHLAGTAQGIALTVTDDGRGFDVDAVSHRGLGLISMSERLEPFGGTLRIHSEPGGGTRVEAFAPWSTAPAAQPVSPRAQSMA